MLSKCSRDFGNISDWPGCCLRWTREHGADEVQAGRTVSNDIPSSLWRRQQQQQVTASRPCPSPRTQRGRTRCKTCLLQQRGSQQMTLALTHALTGSAVFFCYFADIMVSVDWFGRGYLIFRAQSFRGGRNSAALLRNCTGSTDTQDIKQLYQIIYFYNSHFRTLFTPPTPHPQALLLSWLYEHRNLPSMPHFIS